MVEFAGVQQQLNTNDSLATLVSLQQTAQSTQALGFVGKTAVVNGNTAALSNSSATWQLSVPSNSNVDITIASSTGQTVYTGSYSVAAGNNQTFTWNGQGNDGTKWPDGGYTLTATAKDSSNNTVAVTTADRGRGQLGRPHPVAAAAVDQWPDLHGQPDPEHRELTAPLPPSLAAVVRPDPRPGPGARAAGRHGIFKEIRIEALGLGKF